MSTDRFLPLTSKQKLKKEMKSQESICLSPDLGLFMSILQLKSKSVDHDHFWRFPSNFTYVLIWLNRKGCWKDAVCFCTYLSKFLILELAKAEGWKGNEKLDSIWDVSSLQQHLQEQKYLAASEKWKVTSSSISEENMKRRQSLIYCTGNVCENTTFSSLFSWVVKYFFLFFLI